MGRSLKTGLRSRATAPLKAVFFDAGGTMLRVRPSVGHVYAGAVAELGFRVDPEGVNRSFQEAWKRSLERRKQAGYSASDDLLRSEWRQIVTESFDGLVPPEVSAGIFERLYEHFAGPEPWSLAEGAVGTLEALRAEGLHLGVLSNWDSRLPAILDRLGIRSLFDSLVLSCQVGVEKPHPNIFLAAARKAKAAPGSLLLVGDSLEQDIIPAAELGWRAVWISEEPPVADLPPGVGRIARFSEVLEQVQKASGPRGPGGEKKKGRPRLFGSKG